MEESIREKIMKNILETLKKVKTEDGYANTLGHIQRWDKRGRSFSPSPAVILRSAEEKCASAGKGQPTICTFLVSVECFFEDPTENGRSSDVVFLSLLDDIRMVLLWDVTRGGLAKNTFAAGIEPSTEEEIRSFSSFTVWLEITYEAKDQ